MIKDFVINSPYQPVEPIVIFGPASYLGILTVRMNENNSTDSNIKSIEKIFKTFSPEYPLQYELVSEQYDSKFRTEQNLSKILSFFTVLSLIISFLGLIGLTAFEIERRKKEIGIRKILGASNRAITGILSKEFMLIAGISILISYPVTTYIMQRFLDKFAYRIPLSWLVFGIVAIGILTITALVVSLQTRQLLHQKLVNHLRDE